jgi:hypothetical protein
MKKRLEAELISIAHRILKLKNKSEVDQLYKETQKLYEALSVLKFYQDNFESVKADMDSAVLDEKIEKHLEEESPVEVVFETKEATISPETEVEMAAEVEPEAEESVSEETDEEAADASEETDEEVEETPEETTEPEDIVQPESEVEVAAALEVEPEIEEPKMEEEPEETKADEPFFTPIFELEAEEESQPAELASEMTPETPKVRVEDFLNDDFRDPIFVKPNDVTLFPSSTTEETGMKSSYSSEASSKSIAIGLNDRIGFVKHLFDESNEDFNRVLSQLNTFDTFEEAKNFIDDMVKPDYNNWQGEEDFAERFMELIENKFQ